MGDQSNNRIYSVVLTSDVSEHDCLIDILPFIIIPFINKLTWYLAFVVALLVSLFQSISDCRDQVLDGQHRIRPPRKQYPQIVTLLSSAGNVTFEYTLFVMIRSNLLPKMETSVQKPQSRDIVGSDCAKCHLVISIVLLQWAISSVIIIL